jgi:hypothetical protein
MRGAVVVDTNLLLLLVVGASSKAFIAMHRRLNGYTAADFELLTLLISEFSEIVLLPHIVAETSNFVRNIGNPARSKVQLTLKTLILTTIELPIASAFGALRYEFLELGITDAVILHLCGMDLDGIRPTLITVDSSLADNASALGYQVIDYKSEYMSDRL